MFVEPIKSDQSSIPLSEKKKIMIRIVHAQTTCAITGLLELSMRVINKNNSTHPASSVLAHSP